MNHVLKSLLDQTLKRLGVGVTSYAQLQHLIERSRTADDLDFILARPEQYSMQLLQYLRKSKSQLRQDLFVLSELGFRRNGYFVEFGATNGIDLSNTYLLENDFSWNGILAEPARCWQTALRNNRSCRIETACVWRETGSVLSFNEIDIAELSTIHSYGTTDLHSQTRHGGKTYDVKTISLVDLLDKYDAPRQIDYLSIDTEGSEYEILSSFDFDRYRFGVISCEHNYTPIREQIYSLLTGHGYVRKLEQVSKFDDWYVSAQ
jgi:FkbM family methyltransferase